MFNCNSVPSPDMKRRQQPDFPGSCQILVTHVYRLPFRAPKVQRKADKTHENPSVLNGLWIEQTSFSYRSESMGRTLPLGFPEK